MNATVKEHENLDFRSKVVHAAAKLFLQKGYSQSTLREIATEADVKFGSLCFYFKNKEALLCELVAYVLEGQFTATGRLLAGKTDDSILFYAAETTLQLYMAESSEHIRELYTTSYSMPNSSAIIYRSITGKLEEIFRDHLPDWETKNFYEKEIASAGIMRNYLSVPCDMYFTMERKIRAFLEATFLVYRVSDEKIEEAIAFVSQFDWEAEARHVIDNLLVYLEQNT